MKKIVDQVMPTTMLESIKDTAYVGVVKKDNKYIVVVNARGGDGTPYTLMDVETRTSKYTYNSVKTLLKREEYNEAFEFEDAKEMYNWFIQ